MKKGELISIIVPIYNVEEYLCRCIDSILNQSYKNFELILVDDGSPDNCPKICDAYAKRDHRIIVIHKKNGGLSDARNYGIEIAKGKFLIFIDSDDFIHSKYVEKMYLIQKETKSDLVICGYNTVVSMDDIDFKQEFSNQYKIVTPKQAINQIYSDIPYNGLIIVVAWNKLYKRELFKNIRYPFGKISEDNFVIVDILEQCEKIAISEDKMYYYVISENSITRSKYSIKNFDLLDAMELRTDKIIKYGNEVYKKHINYYLNQIYIDYYRTSDKLLRNMLRKRLHDIFFSNLKKNNLYINTSIIKFILFFISPVLSKAFVNIISKIKSIFK